MKEKAGSPAWSLLVLAQIMESVSKGDMKSPSKAGFASMAKLINECVEELLEWGDSAHKQLNQLRLEEEHKKQHG